MNRHQICAALVCSLALFVSFNAADAQSRDRDNPTLLTSSAISGVIDSDSRGNIYYYSFWANPGEVVVTLTVDPGNEVDGRIPSNLTTVGFSLFDRNAEEISNKAASTYLGEGSKQAVARVEIAKRQLLVLAVNIPSGLKNFNSVGGKYRLRISGTVEFHGTLDGSLATSLRRTENKSGGCLPKQGTLIIKMKDGSKKIVDLNEAETITVVP